MSPAHFTGTRLADAADPPGRHLAPGNPFLTGAYADAMRAIGFEVWSLHGLDVTGDDRAAVGFVTRGRINSSMLLPSMPRLGSEAPFWLGLWRFCVENAITQVAVSSAASEGVEIPTVPGEMERVPRSEFVIELGTADLWAGVGRSHRDRIKQGRKNGLAVARSRDDTALAAHVQLHRKSMERRANRGEVVSIDEDDTFMRALLHSGAGELYQATSGEQILSSLLMIRSATGAYSQSSGNSPEGMKVGASHFLRYETAVMMGERGVKEFYLGGCRAHETGLRSFKQGFGAREIPMTSIEAYLGGQIRRKLSTALDSIRRDSRSLVHGMRARLRG